MAKTSESMLKAINKYQSEKVDEFKVRVPKGEKVTIQEFAKSQGKSLNAYVVKIIKEDMEKQKAVSAQ